MLYRPKRHPLRTRLSPEEVRRRLEECRVGLLWDAITPLPRPRRMVVRGRVSERGFRLERAAWLTAPARHVASGTVLRDGVGTRVEVAVGEPWTSGAFSLVALGGAAWLLWLAASNLLRSGGPAADPADLLFLVGPALLLVGFALVPRVLARGDSEWLLAFLEETLEAERVPEAGGADAADTPGGRR